MFASLKLSLANMGVGLCITVFLLVHFVHVCIHSFCVWWGCVCLQVGCGGKIACCWVYNMQWVLVIWVPNLFADDPLQVVNITLCQQSDYIIQ